MTINDVWRLMEEYIDLEIQNNQLYGGVHASQTWDVL